MFKTITRALLPNPLEQILRKAKRKKHTRFLLAWNRGLGDIALGLYAIVHRIKEVIPNAEITFVIRKNLKEGFSLFPEVKTLIAEDWERSKPYNLQKTLQDLRVSSSSYDVMIAFPNPTYWVKWQRGKLTPKLTWKKEYDALEKAFSLDEKYTYIGVQPLAETHYGHWRNLPEKKWKELFALAEKRQDLRFLLFGYGSVPSFSQKNVIDLRGKTSLYSLLSIIKNRCKYLILPDSGILSMAFYLNESFPIKVISLWGDPRHGILKQSVASPNPQLEHIPLIGEYKNLDSLTSEKIFSYLN